ncbi:MAG: 16S rRNA processing protein RimM [Bacteroidota bacterium]|nr:16S rRNA processing protein RimM [Bacteroidota bacterium]
MQNYIHIGRIVATFGIKGEIIIHHGLGKKTALKGIEALFIEELKGSYLPYFIQQSKAKDHEDMYVQLEGINSKEAAHRFIHKNVYLLEEDFRKVAGKSSPIALIGFTVVNDNEALGKVEEVIEQPHQVLLRIEFQTKEILIPLNESTLQKVDQKLKQVHVSLPDGLLEIYLES